MIVRLGHRPGCRIIYSAPRVSNRVSMLGTCHCSLTDEPSLSPAGMGWLCALVYLCFGQLLRDEYLRRIGSPRARVDVPRLIHNGAALDRERCAHIIERGATRYNGRCAVVRQLVATYAYASQNH
jgi:hypothetical protein